MPGGPFRGFDEGTMFQAFHQGSVQPELRRPAVVQGLAWVMVCWGAYAHSPSIGGARGMALNGTRRMMAPQWAQVRGASMATGGASLWGFGTGSSALACSRSPPDWAEAWRPA